MLYHFTSKHHIEGCKRQGIKLGVLPDFKNGKVVLVKGFQWLTTNPNFSQEWNTQQEIKYDRTEYRITIQIPRIYKHKILNWLELSKNNKVAKYLNAFGDRENWRIFKGIIRPTWFEAIDHKYN